MKLNKNNEIDFTKPKNIAKAINILFDELLKINKKVYCFSVYTGEEERCRKCAVKVQCKKFNDKNMSDDEDE